MADLNMVLEEAHRDLLLNAQNPNYRIGPDYAPAIDLINTGYCIWMRNNPQTYQLELTVKGINAVEFIKRPDAAANFRVEKVDDHVWRVLNGKEIAGIAIKQPDGTWAAYDDKCCRFDKGRYSSPEAVLLSLKMFEASLEAHLEQLDLSEMRMAM